MSRLTSTLCGLAFLTAGGTALAAEPLKLSDQALDAVTAGALIGVRLDVLALSGPNQSAIAVARSVGFESGQIFAFADAASSGDGFFAAGALGNDNQFAGGSGNPNDVGTAEAAVGGNITTNDGPLFSSLIGIFQAETATTGSGVAEASVQPVILSGTPVINKTLVVPFGNTALIGVLLAATD